MKTEKLGAWLLVLGFIGAGAVVWVEEATACPIPFGVRLSVPILIGLGWLLKTIPTRRRIDTVV